ncbi:MAG: hypothetical protein ACI9QC_000348 [Oceanicoccus sp.]|jgi:hypothetical protein
MEESPVEGVALKKEGVSLPPSFLREVPGLLSSFNHQVRGRLRGNTYLPIGDIGRRGTLSYDLLAEAFTIQADGVSGFELTPEELRGLEQAWEKATSAPFVQGVLGPLVELVKARMAECDEEGRNYLEVSNGLALRVELEGMLPLGDINAYSQISTQGGTAQKVRVSEDFYKGLKQVGGVLVEQIQGDAALPVIPGGLAEGLSAMRAYQQLMITIEDPDLIGARRPETGELYFPEIEHEGQKINHATFSLGLQKGKVVIDLQTGKNGGRGLIRAHGEDYNSVTKLQTQAQPGQSLLALDLIADARNLGVDVTDEGLIHGIPERFNSKAQSLPTVDFPKDNLILAVKVIETLCKLYPNLSDTAAFTQEGEMELTSQLNCTYMVAKFISADGGEVTEMDAFWTKLASEGTGSDHVEYFKVVGDSVHCTAQINNTDDWKGVLSPFFEQMHQVAQSMGLEVHISLAHEEALELLPVPGTAYVDYTGNAIVAAYRGASLKREGSWISLDRSFLRFAGLMTNEMSTFAAKGVPYQHVFWDIEKGGDLNPHESKLIGVEHIEEAIGGFLSEDDSRKVMQVLPPAGFEETGSGVSAMQRRAMKIAIDDHNYQLNRVLFVHGRKSDPRVLVAQLLACSLEDLSSVIRSVTEPILIVKEGPTSVLQQQSIDWLVRQAHAANVPLKFIVDSTVDLSGDFYSASVCDHQSLRELTLIESLGMIFEARSDLDPATDTLILRTLVLNWVNHEAGRWLVPRAVLNDLAVHIIKDGHKVSLPSDSERISWAGELGRELETKNISQRARTLVGVLALVGEPLTGEKLLEAYNLAFGGDLTMKDLSLDLGVLSQSGKKPFIVKKDGRYCLGAAWDRNLAMVLARKGERAIRIWTIEKCESSEVSESHLESVMREFEHRMGVSEFCGKARTFDLVADLIEYYGAKKNIAGAMTIARRYMQAMDRYRQFLNPCSENKRVILKMAWVVMQSGTAKEKDVLSAYLEVMKGLQSHIDLSEEEKSELYWRSAYNYNLNRNLPQPLEFAQEHSTLIEDIKALNIKGFDFPIIRAQESLAKWNVLNRARTEALSNNADDSAVIHGLNSAMGYQLSFALSRLRYVLKQVSGVGEEVSTRMNQVLAGFESTISSLVETVPNQILTDLIGSEIQINSWRLLAGMRRSLFGPQDEGVHRLFRLSLDGYKSMKFPVEPEMYDTENGAMSARVFRVLAWLDDSDVKDGKQREKIASELVDMQEDLTLLTAKLAEAAHHPRLADICSQMRNTYELMYRYYKKFEPEHTAERMSIVDEYIALDKEMERLCVAIDKTYQKDQSFYEMIEALDEDEETKELEK